MKVTIEALRQLKFGVEDVDEDLTPGTAKVEDLRLTDPDDPAWTNITEVRGYTGGAKLSDLQRIGRFAGLFLRRTGEFPKSRWYLVNQFLRADPDTRQRPLVGVERRHQGFVGGWRPGAIRHPKAVSTCPSGGGWADRAGRGATPAPQLNRCVSVRRLVAGQAPDSPCESR